LFAATWRGRGGAVGSRVWRLEQVKGIVGFGLWAAISYWLCGLLATNMPLTCFVSISDRGGKGYGWPQNYWAAVGGVEGLLASLPVPRGGRPIWWLRPCPFLISHIASPTYWTVWCAPCPLLTFFTSPQWIIMHFWWTPTYFGWRYLAYPSKCELTRLSPHTSFVVYPILPNQNQLPRCNLEII